MAEKKLEVWTDGACKGNPGPGGWGARLQYGAARKDLYGGSARTTNNRMELIAVIAALSSIKRPMPVTIHTDSQYVKNGVEKWIASWKRRGWKKAGGGSVKNVGHWKELLRAAEPFDITWRWVKGHDGDEGNEAADLLANQGVEEARGERAACGDVPAALRGKIASLEALEDDLEADLS